MSECVLKEEFKLAVEAEVLSPDAIGELGQEEIRKLPMFLGKRQFSVGDFFQVEGERSRNLEIRGNLAQVKWIGRGMTSGSIKIYGNAGMHLGAALKGGLIKVYGDAADWLGAEMTGGQIHIHGNAGGQAGAAYRGSQKGMRGGVILIDGTAGIEVGMRMRRGLIYIRGRVGDFAGLQMRGGTIFLEGAAGIRTGAWMSRGTIVTLEPLQLLPTFIYACTYKPAFLGLVIKQLSDLGAPISERAWYGFVQRYIGDTSGLAKGEILVCAKT
jgi:formylmethanofuran dehydrogenase subunit C